MQVYLSFGFNDNGNGNKIVSIVFNFSLVRSIEKVTYIVQNLNVEFCFFCGYIYFEVLEFEKIGF